MTRILDEVMLKDTDLPDIYDIIDSALESDDFDKTMSPIYIKQIRKVLNYIKGNDFDSDKWILKFNEDEAVLRMAVLIKEMEAQS